MQTQPVAAEVVPENRGLKSRAVPKGSLIGLAIKRVAVEGEGRNLDYADFKGVIRESEYGGGPVLFRTPAGLSRSLTVERSPNPCREKILWLAAGYHQYFPLQVLTWRLFSVFLFEPETLRRKSENTFSP